MISLRTELKAVEGEAEEKRVKLEASLSEAREQLIQAKASSELQARQAEKTIEDFKAQVQYVNPYSVQVQFQLQKFLEGSI